MPSPAILAVEPRDDTIAAAGATLLLPARAAVVVGGVPGAGKTTLLDRVARASKARVLDSADVRSRIRRRLGPRVPYAAFRPLVHALHLLAVWRALGDHGDEPVVVHDCATRGAVRRAMLRRARAVGRPVVLLALDVDGHDARGGQRDRGRRVSDRAMLRHERRWRAMLDGATAKLLAEGFARVHVLARHEADAIGALRFARPMRHDPAMGARYDDDDDWVGTPPEGRHSRDRAKPEFWRGQRPIVPALVGIFFIVVIILLVALLG